MSAEQRLAAADAFWREDQADVQVQHADAILSIAKRLNFRAKQRAGASGGATGQVPRALPDISDAVATRALISYHFTAKRDLMAAFLDALGIAHENGLIGEESVTPPTRDQLFGRSRNSGPRSRPPTPTSTCGLW